MATQRETVEWSRQVDGAIALVAQRCAQCRELTFPPTAELCPSCWSTELTSEPVEATGSVYSSTVVRRSFPGRTVPYAIALIDLPAGLRVMAAVAGDLDRLGPGTGVRAVASSESRPEFPATAYEFRPVD